MSKGTGEGWWDNSSMQIFLIIWSHNCVPCCAAWELTHTSGTRDTGQRMAHTQLAIITLKQNYFQ